jgi:hypothetical protein
LPGAGAFSLALVASGAGTDWVHEHHSPSGAEHGIDIGPYRPVVERAWDEQVWDCP